MAGGLMQLVAYGAQDVYLTGNPKVTFFQAVYKRHTNFAMENIEQTVNGTAGDSGRVSVTVARNGDLVGDMYLQMTAKTGLTTKTSAADYNWVAERAVNNVELSIGGQRIDKHYQKWWRLYDNLYHDESKKASYAKMATTDGKKTVYLPLLFFFNRNPGLYLPLIALQYHEVRIDIDLAGDFSTFLDTTSGVKVWANYIYLDTEERRRFAQKGHEYLIEQVQHTGNDSVTSGSPKQVRLSYNHPVKELIWCFSNTSADNKTSLWNFTSKNLTSNIVLESDATAVSESNCFVPVTQAAGVPLVSVGTGGSNEKYTEEAVGPLNEFKLVLNGQDRFKAQEGKYFNQVQPFNHHTGSPAPGVYSYSFALKPEEHQPTGTCNFSRIDNAQVAVTMNSTDATTMHMFATNYNVLRIQSGMGGLAFSN
jgi:hypothetical protein